MLFTPVCDREIVYAEQKLFICRYFTTRTTPGDFLYVRSHFADRLFEV